jgi:hypothetical protein
MVVESQHPEALAATRPATRVRSRHMTFADLGDEDEHVDPTRSRARIGAVLGLVRDGSG